MWINRVHWIPVRWSLSLVLQRLGMSYGAQVTYGEFLVREWSLSLLVGSPAWMGYIQRHHGFSYLPTGFIPDRRGMIPWKEPEFTRGITISDLGKIDMVILSRVQSCEACSVSP